MTIANLTLDGSGNLFIGGATNGSIDNFSIWDPAGAKSNYYLLKFDTSGTQLSSNELGLRKGSINPTGIAIDTNGNLFLAGSVNVNYDDQILANAGKQNYFITKFNSALEKQ